MFIVLNYMININNRVTQVWNETLLIEAARDQHQIAAFQVYSAVTSVVIVYNVSICSMCYTEFSLATYTMYLATSLAVGVGLSTLWAASPAWRSYCGLEHNHTE